MNRQKTLYQPKISILIPLHNSAKYFNSTIKTILNQSYENLEILFHDDASNDETRKILEDLTIKDSRVKYIFSDTNIGSGYSRNKLIEASTGNFIFFIDDDDEFLSPKIIERCVKYLKPNLEILSTQFKYKFDDLGIKIPINNIVKTLKINPSPMHYYLNTTTFAWGHFFNKKFLYDIDVNFSKVKKYEDIAEMGNIFSKCKNFKRTLIYSIIYHRKTNSLSSFDKNYINKIECINQAYKFNLENIVSNLKNDISFKILKKTVNSLFMEHLSLISVYYINLKNRNLKKEFKKFIKDIYPSILEIYNGFDVKIKYRRISDLPVFVTKFLYKKPKVKK